MSVAVIFEVHASNTRELHGLFWDEVDSNHASLQNLVSLWLKTTQSVADKLQSSKATEKEKDAVLQFLTKLNVVRCAGSKNDQQSTEGSSSEAVSIEPKATDEATAPDDISPAGTSLDEVTEDSSIERRDVIVKQEVETHPTKNSVEGAVVNEVTNYKQEEVVENADGMSDEDDNDDGDADYNPADDDDDDYYSEDDNDDDETVCETKYDIDSENCGENVDSDKEQQDHELVQSIYRSLSMQYDLSMQNDSSSRCHICKEMFTDPAQLEQHVKGTHDVYRKHICTLCDKHFGKKADLRRHTGTTWCMRRQKERAKNGKQGTSNMLDTSDKLLSKGKVIKSRRNNKTSNSAMSSSGASRHVNFDDGFICRTCNQTFADPALLRQHLKEIHESKKKHICTLCDKRFDRPSGLQKHVESCKHRLQQKAERNKQGGSKKVAKGLSDQNRVHVEGEEDDDKNGEEGDDDLSDADGVEENTHRCSICDKVLTSFISLRKHVQNHMVKKETRGETYKCDKCSNIYKKFLWFQKHKCPEIGFKYQCTLCGSKYKTQEELQRHDNEFHKKIKTHFCHLCPVGFRKKSDLTRHIKHVHEKTDLVSCDVCGKMLANKRYLKQHYSVHAKDKSSEMPASKTQEHRPQQCELCGKVCFNEYRLKAHMMIHGPKNFKCTLCERAFITKYVLKVHMESVHLKVREKLCQECGKAFYTNAHLKEHINIAHRKVRPHVCEQCGKGFYRPNCLRRHHVFCGKMKRVKANRPTYPCDQCNRVCTTPSMLAMHKVSHSTERNFKCNKCNSSYKRKYELELHDQRVHQKKKYVCQLKDCGKKFALTSQLNVHVNRVHKKMKEKVFPCTLCGKILHSSVDLEHHQAWHNGLSDLKCGTCGKVFDTRAALRLHTRIHRSDGWRCTECGLGFKNQEECAKHKAVVHFGVTDWNKCKQCGKEFTTHQSMRRHMKNHAGAGCKCGFCGEIFPTVYAKAKHAQKVHRSKSKLQAKSKSESNVENKSNVEFESNVENKSSVELENEQAITFIVTSEEIIQQLVI